MVLVENFISAPWGSRWSLQEHYKVSRTLKDSVVYPSCDFMQWNLEALLVIDPQDLFLAKHTWVFTWSLLFKTFIFRLNFSMPGLGSLKQFTFQHILNKPTPLALFFVNWGWIKVLYTHLCMCLLYVVLKLHIWNMEDFTETFRSSTYLPK